MYNEVVSTQDLDAIAAGKHWEEMEQKKSGDGT